MTVNLSNEQALNNFIERLVFNGGSLTKIQNHQLKDPAFLSIERDRLIPHLIYNWARIRLWEHFMKSSDAPHFEQVVTADRGMPLWVFNAVKFGKTVHRFNPDKIHPEFYTNYQKIHSYLYKMAENYLDKEGKRTRPKARLDYFKTFRQYKTYGSTLNEAEKWHSKLVSDLEKRQIQAKGLLHIMDLEDGFSIYKLTTPEILDLETEFMRHCIGRGSYDDKLLTGDVHFFSLRDKHKIPHVTFEVQDNEIVQCAGIADKAVVEKYISYIHSFINKTCLKPKICLKNMGLVSDVHGEHHNLYQLPDGLNVEDLDLSNLNVSKLPQHLTVNGNLNISGSLIRELPAGLKVAGNINMGHCPVSRLSENMYVGGSLSLENTLVDELPTGLVVMDGLSLFNTKIKSLPADIKVGRKLDISGTKVEYLPPHLNKFDTLILNRSSIRYLPDDLEIKTELYLARCENLESIPAHISDEKIHGLSSREKERLKAAWVPMKNKIHNMANNNKGDFCHE